MSIRRSLTWLPIAIFAAALIGLPLAPHASADPPPKAETAEARAAAALVPFLFAPDQPLHTELKAMEFDKALPPPEKWPAYSTEDLILIAARMAKNADPKEGDVRFLSTLSAALSRYHDPLAAGEDKLLKPFVDRGLAEPSIRQFIDPSARVRWAGGATVPTCPVKFLAFEGEGPKLTPGVEEAVRRLAPILDAVYPLGTPVGFFSEYFGMEKKKVVEAIADAKGRLEEVLRRTMGELKAEEQTATVERIVKDCVSDRGGLDYWVLEADPAIRPFLPKPPPPPPGGPVAPPKPLRGPHSRPSSDGAAKRWERSMDRTYGEPKEGDPKPTVRSRDFKEMGTKVKDFGGGVLGSPVKADDLPKGLKTLTFVPNAMDNTTGELVLTFAEGAEVVYSPVLTEDVYAAHAVVNGDQGIGRGWKPGDGIGLVGLSGLPYYDFGLNGIRQLTQWNVLLHPKLVDTELGHAAVMTDILPTSGRRLLLQGAEKAGGKAARARVDALLSDLAKREGGASVFVDLPMRLTNDKGKLVVIADPTLDDRYAGLQKELTDLPEALRKVAFLELRLQTDAKAEPLEKRYDREFAAKFYRHLPLLTAASHDLHRMNRLAPVVAIFRWASEQKAECREMPGKPTAKEKTPDAIVTANLSNGVWPLEEVIRPVQDTVGEEAVKDTRDRAKERMGRLEKDVNGLAELIKAMDEKKLQALTPLVKASLKEQEQKGLTPNQRLYLKFIWPVSGKKPMEVDILSVGIVIGELRKSDELRKATEALIPDKEPAEVRTALAYWLELRAIHNVLDSWKLK